MYYPSHTVFLLVSNRWERYFVLQLNAQYRKPSPVAVKCSKHIFSWVFHGSVLPHGKKVPL